MSEPRGEWRGQEPPGGFADRVMDRIAREEAPAVPRPKARRWGAIAGLALAASFALAMGARAWGGHSRGDAIAADREQVALGSRAIAVLERGAHVRWEGDDVSQPAGDVFYRVEPGGSFRVHTPAGDVTVLGTCFRVRVTETDEKESEVVVNGRDVKAAVIGAGLATAALVSVYEGKVAVTRSEGRDTVTLSAGEAARADATGLHRAIGEEGAGAVGSGPGANGGGADEPLLAANANLTDSVRDYKHRLEALEAEKKAVEKQLKDAQDKLATAANDGQALPKKSEFDLTKNDWKKMADEGNVAARYPCLSPSKTDGIRASDLQKMGLPASDGPLLTSAMDASRARVWTTLRPLCVNALQGDTALADKLGPNTCVQLVRDVAASSGTDVSEDMRQVAEINAGERAVPANADPVITMMLALTNESNSVEQDLAKQVGPNDARELVFGDDSPGCWNNSRWGVGPRATAGQ